MADAEDNLPANREDPALVRFSKETILQTLERRVQEAANPGEAAEWMILLQSHGRHLRARDEAVRRSITGVALIALGVLILSLGLPEYIAFFLIAGGTWQVAPDFVRTYIEKFTGK